MSPNASRPAAGPYWLLLITLITITLTSAALPVAHAARYYDDKSLGRRLASLADEHPDLVRVESIARSIGGRKVWLVEVGRGTRQDRKTRPAMLVVAGIEGNDLIGSSVALAWVGRLAEQDAGDPNVARLLKTTTIYVIPRVNPDAAERFFARPQLETPLNDKPVDDDHDGLVDEDGPEDLNGDGLITWMRIEDPEGEYILDPKDNRLLVKADPLKGEVGAWRYLTEGIDNDHDQRWNEDGPGGVNFNRNFPYDYKFFAPDAGVYQVSETETRALADFIVAHPNIGIVVTYGAADDLSKTPKSAAAPDRRKPLTAIDERDVGYYKAMGESFRKALGLDKEIEGSAVHGSFSDWMYFDRGRLSLAARAWTPAFGVEMSKVAEGKEKAKEQEESGESDRRDSKKGNKKNATDDRDKRNEEQREQLKWFDEHAPGAFLKWRPINHPDFPGERAEVGGYRPFALTNPPAEMIDQITAKHCDFLTAAARKLPRIGVRKIETHLLGRSVYEVKIQIENTGFLPTVLAHGQRTQEINPTRLVLSLDDVSILSGTRITYLPPIRGSGGMTEVRYIIRAAGRRKIDFKLISALAGYTEGTIDLQGTE
jgi:Zinc carboxypeptidase